MSKKQAQAKSGIGQFIRKAILITLTGICLVLGVIGLVLPIIPGILFLFLAACFLAKLSSRFANRFNQNRFARKWKNRGDAFKQLSAGERIKLSFLYTAKSIVDSVDSLWQRIAGTGSKAAN
ncbi:MAG: DUF454 family protein [Pseudohongiellaceae bacterium]